MGLTTALFTGLTGLNANSQMITVTGNNIANVNTNGFKTSRISFETQISRTLKNASGPNGDAGGSNPVQIGLGTQIASIGRNFDDGSLQPTGINTDVAIEGPGFFILEDQGSTRYTRAGNFELNGDFDLVRDGAYVQGFGVDNKFNIIEGVLGQINIGIGVLTLAEATRAVKFRGNLNASGDASTTGAVVTSNKMLEGEGGAAATASTALAGLFSETGSAPLFADGDVITLSGALKGGVSLPDKTFEIGAANTTESDDVGTTMQDLMDFLTDVLGIDTGVSGGISVTADGELLIEGNGGTINNLNIDSANFIRNVDTAPTLPFIFSQSLEADGESVRTTFVAFDSLGSPVTVDMGMVLEAKTTTGTQWRFYLQSEEDTDLSRVLGTGTVDFDTNGELVSVLDSTFTLDREGTGAFSPQSVTIEFTDPLGTLSALASSDSSLAALSQDGSPAGTLEDFSISNDGTVVGIFSNSLLRNLGSIALASFANPQGLEDIGSNLFRSTTNSGIAAVVTPGTSGAGRTIGSALELSNVDLSQEFIGLITASTGFSASSRVLTTADQLIQELLSILR